jgi:hypothetical protein
MSDREHQWEIGVCTTEGWAKYPIQFATKGRYTHSYLVTGDDAAEYGLEKGTYSMEPGGLIWRPYDYWGADNPHSRFRLVPFERQLVAEFVLAHGEAKYDYLGDLIVGLDDLTPAYLDKLFHQIEHIEDELNRAWFCSAFTDAAFTAAGIHVFTDGRPFHAVTPMDLYRLFEKQEAR